MRGRSLICTLEEKYLYMMLNKWFKKQPFFNQLKNIIFDNLDMIMSFLVFFV